MKRIAALLLLCLLLAGCTQDPPVPTGLPTSVPITAAPSAAPVPEPPAHGSLERLTDLDLEQSERMSLACPAPQGAAILTLKWDQQEDEDRLTLWLLDPDTASVMGKVDLGIQTDLWDVTALEVTEEEIRLINEPYEHCAVFDLEGKRLEDRDYPVMDSENRGWRNRLLSDDSFYRTVEYAQFSDYDSEELAHVAAFYDETDAIHILPPGDYTLDGPRGHRLAAIHNAEDGPGQCRLLDLDRDLCLDAVTIPPEENSGWIYRAVQGEDWVLLETEDGLYLWYPDEANATPLGAETLNEAELERRVEALKTELEPQGLIFHLDDIPDPALTPTTGLDGTENYCEGQPSLFGQYRILSQLRDFVGKLPPGFVRELYSDLPDEDADRDGLHIYIVREIPGTAAGFANTWSDTMLICFATEEYSRSHLAHEFMHVIDYRINQVLFDRGRELYDEWGALSPDYAYDDWLTDEEEEEVWDYFVSSYARTNQDEDRAETFQWLFDSEAPMEENLWYRDYPKVQEKVAYLVRTIREVFPSAAAADTLWWERWLPGGPGTRAE